MKSEFIRIIALLSPLLLVGCSTIDSSIEQTGNDGTPLEASIEIPLEDGRWVYFSLSSGEVVGSSDFNAPSEDLEWSLRTDWDIALCDGFIRTNSGTSGSAGGGIQITDTDYSQVDSAPTEGYRADTTFGGEI